MNSDKNNFTMSSSLFSLKNFVLYLILFFINCINDKENYYSNSEANVQILKAFILKDGICNVTHKQITWIRGSSLKRDLDRCVRDIYIVDCVTWANPDPAPLSCKIIEYK